MDYRLLKTILKLDGGITCACGTKLNIIDIEEQIDSDNFIIIVESHINGKNQEKIPVGYVVYNRKKAKVHGRGTFANPPTQMKYVIEKAKRLLIDNPYK